VSEQIDCGHGQVKQRKCLWNTITIFDRTAHLLSGHPLEVVPALSSDYPTAAKRPRNSVLSNERLQQ
jgi:dTDP-4-dehydrorhamnose reductase